jgi:hypothetical protein
MNPYRVRRYGEMWIVRHVEFDDCHFGMYDSHREARRSARAHRRGDRWWRRREFHRFAT